MDDLRSWLEDLGLGEYAQAFADNDIGPDLIGTLDDSDLREIGISSLGHRKRILAAIRERTVPRKPPPRKPVNPGERRQLTILFCDLAHDWRGDQAVDPEDLQVVMETYQRTCRTVVDSYDGHVSQLLGDGLMVYFGWPRAHEDDAGRAIRSALDMIDAVGAGSPGRPAQPRIGIATGPVVISESGGSAAAMPKLAVGETPNIAARLQGLAKPGQIIISPTTHRLAGGQFDYEDLGDQALKGIIEPIRARRVIGLKTAADRFEAAQTGDVTELIGRETELSLLVERWESACQGEAEAVLLSGQAGIGKSRLSLALRDRAKTDGANLWLLQCSPHYSNSPLHPFIDRFERAASIARDDSTTVKQEKVRRYLSGLGIADSTTRSGIAQLLSLPVDDDADPGKTPHRKREDVLAAIARWMIARADSAPLLLELEDAQWIDPTSADAVHRIMAQAQGRRVMILVTARPGYQPEWRGDGQTTELVLNKLTRSQSAAVAAHVAGDKPLPPMVLNQITMKADGVPLFAEELTRAVLESGVLREQDGRYVLDGPLPQMAIPATLQDSLMARLDRLAALKDVVQAGAAIGREFSFALLARASAADESEIRRALRQLEDSEIVFVRSAGTEPIYVFKHALLRDAAYESLLKTARVTLHARIAQALQSDDLGGSDVPLELLAHHLTEALLVDKAIPMWLRAGQLANTRSAYREAIAHLSTGIGLLPGLADEDQRNSLELELQTQLGIASMSAIGHAAPQAGAAFERAEELCLNMGEAPRLLPVLRGVGGYYWMSGNLAPAKRCAVREFEIAETLCDPSDIVFAHTRLGSVELCLGHFAQSGKYFARALELFDEHRLDERASEQVSRYGFTCESSILGWSSWQMAFQGQLDDAMAYADRVVTHAQAYGHPFTLAFALAMASCGLTFQLREPARARQWSEACIEVSESQGLMYWSTFGHSVLGSALLMQGDVEAAIEQCRIGIDDTRKLGTRLGIPLRLAWLADAHVARGDPQTALELIIEAFAEVESTGENWQTAFLHMSRGAAILALPSPRLDAAQAAFQTAYDNARRQGSILLELRAANRLAEVRQRLGDGTAPNDLVRPIYDNFRQGFSAPDLTQAKTLLDTAA